MKLGFFFMKDESGNGKLWCRFPYWPEVGLGMQAPLLLGLMFSGLMDVFCKLWISTWDSLSFLIAPMPKGNTQTTSCLIQLLYNDIVWPTPRECGHICSLGLPAVDVCGIWQSNTASLASLAFTFMTFSLLHTYSEQLSLISFIQLNSWGPKVLLKGPTVAGWWCWDLTFQIRGSMC